ncbi:MAG: hypothetical protein QM703_14730 [Gemmatales bacterium]
MAKRKSWQSGSLFKVPQSDGTFSLGQVVGREPSALNSVTCAFFDLKISEGLLPAIDWDNLIACLFTTPDLLDNGTWPVIGHSDSAIPTHFLPFEETRSQGWVGAKIHGSGIVRQFLDAYYGLAYWDDWANPNYLDQLLIHPSKKPATLRYKNVPT